MNKLLLSILLISSTISAHSDLFGHDFNHNFWRDFEQQFRQFDYKIKQIQNSSNFVTQSRRYFDNQANNYIIQIKVNGLNKENLNISTNDGSIFIKGSIQKVQNTDQSSSTSSSGFFQSFTLPDDVDTDNINANFSNNILSISIPKLKQLEPEPQIRKITIQ
jgi:HSP20 family protein